MKTTKATKRSSTPTPTKRTSGDITPSVREKSAQRPMTSFLARSRSLNQGNDDLVPSINNSIRSNQHSTPSSTIKNNKNNKNKNTQSSITSTKQKSPSAITNSTTTNDINLQSSINSFFSPSTDGSTKKYEVNTVTPVPSSTVVSSDIAPDPKSSNSRKINKDFVKESNEDKWNFEDRKKGFIDNEFATREEIEASPPPKLIQVGDTTVKPPPSIHGDTLEADDISNYVMKKNNGTTEKLKLSSYYNSWEVHDKERKEDTEKRLAIDKEETVQFQDKTGEEDDQYDESPDDDESTMQYQEKIHKLDEEEEEIVFDTKPPAKDKGIFLTSSDDSSSNGSYSSTSYQSDDSSDSSDKKPAAITTLGETIEINEYDDDDDSTFNYNYKVLDKGTSQDGKPMSNDVQTKDKKDEVVVGRDHAKDEVVNNDPDDDKSMVAVRDHVKEEVVNNNNDNDPDDDKSMAEIKKEKLETVKDQAKFDNSKNLENEFTNEEYEDYDPDEEMIAAVPDDPAINHNNKRKIDEIAQNEDIMEEGSKVKDKGKDKQHTEELNEQEPNSKSTSSEEACSNDRKQLEKEIKDPDMKIMDPKEVDNNIEQSDNKGGEDDQQVKMTSDCDPKEQSNEDHNQETLFQPGEDNESTATPKMGTITGTHHNNLADTTEEDEVGTINSGQTTHKMTAEEANKEKVPPMTIRYLHVYEINSESTKEIEQSFSGEPIVSKSFNDRVRDDVKAALDEMKKIDKDCYFITWAEGNTFSTLSYDPETRILPEATADIAKFFPGFKPNPPKKRGEDGEMVVKSNRIVTTYLKMRVHHPNTSADAFENKMSIWANVNSKRFKRTIIQTENPSNIGWFLYSSNYTDVNRLSKILKRETGYEWGFRVSPITKKDMLKEGTKKVNEYKNRIKALIAVVDQKHSAAAPAYALDRFRTSMYDSLTPTCSFEDRFIFVKLESESKSDETNADGFTKMVGRQKLHQQELIGYFYPWIEGNIDRKSFYTPHLKEKVSLRQLILSIPVKHDLEEDEEDYFEPLFHGFDFTSNSSDKWYDGTRGPGGSGYSFSFYRDNEGKAIQRIRGMAVYLAALDSRNQKPLASIFSPDHFTASKNWVWNAKQDTFITPDTTILCQNLLHDSNRAIVRASDKDLALQNTTANDKAEEEKKKKLQQERNAAIKEQKEAREKDKTYLAATKVLEEQSKLHESVTKEEVPRAKEVTEKVIDASDMLRLKNAEARKIQYNDDGQGSLDVDALGKGTLKEKIMESIEMNDNASTTSSLTAQSVESMVDDILKVKNGEDNNKSEEEASLSSQSIDSATSSLKSVNEAFLSKIIIDAKKDNENITREELAQLAHQAFLMQIKKAVLKGDYLIDKMIGGTNEETTNDNVAISSPPRNKSQSQGATAEEENNNTGTPVKNNSTSANTSDGVGDSK